MEKMLEFFKRKYSWAIVMTILLSIATAYTMLDAFVIPKSYRVVTQAKSGNSAAKTGDIVIAANNSGASMVGNTQKSSDASDESSPGSSDTSAGSSSNSSFASAESSPGCFGEQPSLTAASPGGIADSRGSSGQTEAVVTDYLYKDDDICINIEKQNENSAVFYVADIRITDAGYLKTAFANNTFGKNITETTSEIAQENNAIFAINGDFYGFRDTGLIIRNGVLYRDTARSSPDNKALTVDSDGDMGIVTEGGVSGTFLVDKGILQSFSFGPVLVQDGKVADTSSTRVSRRENPRTAIGQISPLHYIAIVVDGRSNESRGMTLDQLAQEFVERDAAVAYNLDGGGSSTMWLNGRVINNPTDGRYNGERSVSDIIYIGK